MSKIHVPLQPGFLTIPKEVIMATKINGIVFGFIEKGLYSYFWWWCKNNPEVYPSVKRVCEDLGISSRSTVLHQIENLEIKKLLKVTRKKGKSNIYEALSLEDVVISYPNESSLINGTNADPGREEKTTNYSPGAIQYIEDEDRPLF